jgi:hypothetical protein
LPAPNDSNSSTVIRIFRFTMGPLGCSFFSDPRL